MPVVRYPDTELWLTGALRSALGGPFVGIQVPASRREDEVIVRRDGGPEGPILAVQRFGFRVFAPTEKRATDLADDTSAAVRALRFTGPARHITTTSPFVVEDPSGKPCRYFTAEISVRGEPLT